jgi:hypothetical protein
LAQRKWFALEPSPTSSKKLRICGTLSSPCNAMPGS